MTSTTAARVLAHVNDARPGWLFAADSTLIWRNQAAAYFLAKAKKHSVKLAPPAEPIKGQIARVLRLGAEGRTSLSRIHFMAGDKPASSTCACTPLMWEDGRQALLIVGVDAIDADVLTSGAADLSIDEALWRRGALGADAEAAEGKAEMPPDADIRTPEPEQAQGTQEEEAPAPFETEAAARSDAEQIAPVDVPQAEIGTGQPTPEVIEAREPETTATAEAETADLPAPDESLPEAAHRLSELMNRLMAHDTLFQPLTEADEPPAETQQADAQQIAEPAQVEPAAGRPPEADEVAQAQQTASPAGLYRVIGRYLRRPTEEDESAAEPEVLIEPEVPAVEETEAESDLADLARLDAVDDTSSAEGDGIQSPPRPVEVLNAVPEPAPIEESEPDSEPESAEPAKAITPAPQDADAVERVSRYNFDELSRILTDRVGEMAGGRPASPEAERLASAPPGSVLARQRASASAGSLINLGGETLVLNRLPLGLLVFRDQQVLFANRAITEMTGYDSVEALREAGLSAIFPGVEGEAGPVNHLVQRDGTLVPVTARLQSISWQGRPALMLSASATEVRTGHEGAVRAFAEAFADARGDGFFETSRAGTISGMNAGAAAMLADLGDALVGRKLADLVLQSDLPALRDFLERPARFAETARPAIRVKAAVADVELVIFAQGQAGIVSGYFGFAYTTAPAAAPRLAKPAEPDAGLLARLSRGVRRPLNTIIGFSDLIRSAAFGAIDNPRYLDYAQDIKTAGEEIAALVDELDDYARLADGRYLPQRASIDLMGLLESCVRRIRAQAGMRRVIVRNAISENLPRVTADRASLAQAVLNLLASAIDQTPVGGAVVISAQETDEGGIAIHVRDSSDNGTDLSERFVVFRDGLGKDGQALTPVRSSVGLALTRSLLAVNAFSLSVDPAGKRGMLFSMVIPADLVDRG
ncbi:histidine kinase dimerization/phospho-acceptor domain-containing protein [Devosia nitrariae]|nr:histidine kinase dimerization/phospho-acceptor domain-containing protein [Devosia nitrariae]